MPSTPVLTTVARGGAINFIGTILSALSGIGVTLIVTRLVPRDTAGQFFSATAAFLVLAAVASLGTDAGLGRLFPRADPTYRASESRLLLRAALVPALSLSVLVVAVCWPLAPRLADGMGLADPAAVTALRVLSIAIPTFVVGDICLAITRASGNMRATVVIDRFARAGLQLVLVCLAVFAGTGLAGITVAWALPYLISGMLAGRAARTLLRRLVDDPTRSVRRPQTPADVRRRFWRFTWPRSVARVSQMIIQRADIVIIAALLGPAEAAVYTAATRFVPLGQFATQAIQQAAQPRFSTLLADGDLGTLRELYRTTTAWSIALAWPLYITVGSAPFVYLWLFGPEYAAGAGVVSVMALTMLVASATGPVDTMLLMAGRSGVSLANSLVALVLDLGLCVLLIPRMGIIGAALAWAVAVSVRALLATVQVARDVGLRAFGREAAMVATLAVLAFGGPFLALWGSGLRALGGVLGAGLLSLILYAAGLWLLRRPLKLAAFRGFVSKRPGRASRTNQPQRHTNNDVGEGRR